MERSLDGCRFPVSASISRQIVKRFDRISFVHSFEPAANAIPASVFFPQTDPEDRLSQCSASLQALLGLSATSLHALSKLVNNSETSDDIRNADIIGVMRNIIAQFPPKGSPDLDTSVDIPLSVRLWRDMHELLASLGFDLMEVGQDQVTLRTGKQANRRNCQFVLQALLALFGKFDSFFLPRQTQFADYVFEHFTDTENGAPKSLGLDSSSSCESLNEERQESSANSVCLQSQSGLNQQRSVSPDGSVKSASRPPLPFRRALISSGGAFTSYVRRRGEPDGGRTENELSMKVPTFDKRQSNTTDSELSDGYMSQTLNKFEPKPKMGFSSLRGPIKVTRPGGGGESDCAFTPSPPVAVDSSVSLALAHQTRIRNLYSSSSSAEHGIRRDGQIQNSRRPDSSSSASSTTDWEGSGHATVLRRANQSQHLPPLPPPRQSHPMIDNLRPPLGPVYNNLGLESTSSDSEFEKGFDLPTSSNLSTFRGKNKLKPLQQFLSRKISDQIVTEQNSIAFNTNNLYFSPNDTDTMDPKKSMALMKINSKEHKMTSHTKNIQDSILRHMNREMTPTISEVYHERSIGLGLAPPLTKLLLSKNYDEGDVEKSSESSNTNDLDLSLPTVVNGATPTGNASGERCSKCNTNDSTCNCKSVNVTMKKSAKPWLSNVVPNVIQASDLTTADILERQNKIKAKSNDIELMENVNKINNDDGTTILKNGTGGRCGGGSPYTDMSRRDEGDGRSVADSHCSGNYKVDVNSTVQVKQIRNKFNL